MRQPLIILCLIAALALGSKARAADDEVSFSRQVLPILSDRCFPCHGPDENDRKAGLRLDVESIAKEIFDGSAAVMPGSLEKSEAWQRIISEKKTSVMPPPNSHRKPLTEAERDIIKRWILGGAKWGKHWSFETPTRPAAPDIDKHPIDAFVRQRLKEHGMDLSKRAADETLLRRFSFDLTGMAPTPQQVQLIQFSAKGNGFWQKIIDSMLASPHHAERMAMWWLDAARYSDSDGFQQDNDRQNWPWRDWVIQQFASNRPYDAFTRDQFAGDLLPNATDENRLATAFHRHHMTNGEGGRDPEESRIDYVIDRVNTTGTVWLGLALGCVQCHSHKFDPISHQDYYSFFAFFNSIDEDGQAGMRAKPYLKYKSSLVSDRVDEMRAYVDQCLSEEKIGLKHAEQRFETWLNDFKLNPPKDHRVWWMPTPIVTSVEGTEFTIEPDQTVQTHGPEPVQDDYRVTFQIPEAMKEVTGFRLEVLPHESNVGGRFTRNGNGEFTLTSVLALGRRKTSPAERQLEIARAVADVQASPKRKTTWDTRYHSIGHTLNDDARDGWTTEGIKKIEPHRGVFQLLEPWTVEPGDRITIVLRHRSTHGSANIARFRLSLAAERGETVQQVNGTSPIADLVAHLKADAPNPIDANLRKRLFAQFLLSDNAYQQAKQRHATANSQLKQLQGEANPRNVMVLAEREQPRDTHILERGVWDAKGKKVERAFLPNIFDQPSDKALTRLDLADWLMDRDNPLTARVMVNHLWQLMFGQGLVRTPGEFGLQGELPTHPELLDWLAVEFMESGWDVRHILKLILTSKTYQQSSDVTRSMLGQDPENRLLARAPRHRLPAWMIRDNALHVSGLLNPAIGGPPVRPYQPEGVWGEITMGRFHYTPSVGPAQYRRTIYAFWRRSLAPTFLFDSAQRRVCEVGVRRTNTPLHALTLMNDTTMLEASRALADIAVQHQDGEATISQTMDHLAMRVLSRPLSQSEQAAVQSILTKAMQHYENRVDDAVRYTTVGQQRPPEDNTAAATAAWMTVSSLLLNLDEAMTRE